jgi:hypothetical protein
MFRIPRRYSHFVYGFIQSGLTCGIAAAIASFPLMASSSLLKNLEMESFRILADRCWGGAVGLGVVFRPGVGFTLTRGG